MERDTRFVLSAEQSIIGRPIVHHSVRIVVSIWGRNRMSILTKTIGIIVFTIGFEAVPILFVSSVLLGWNGGIKLILLLLMILHLGAVLHVVAELTERVGQT